MLRIGDTVGRWTVLAEAGTRPSSGKNRRFVRCRCSCGTVREVSSSSIAAGQSLSCGCLTRERAAEIGDRSRTHGLSHQDPLYKTWCGIRRRCNCIGDTTNYHKYGAKGISVDARWDDYPAFRQWSIANGYRHGLHIDRIDNSDGYSPENCRWVTSKENQRNRTNNRVIEHDGKRWCVAEWAEWMGAKYNAVYWRVAKGHAMPDIIRAVGRFA